MRVTKASTNFTLDLFIADSSSTTGAGLTGLVFNSSGLVCYYRRGATGSATALTLVTLATIGTAHADGGFKEIDATNMPGLYRLDLSDAILATGVDWVTLHLKGATNMAPTTIRIELTSVDDMSTDFNLALTNANLAHVDGSERVDVGSWLGTAAATPTVAGVPEVDVTHMAGGTQTVTDLKDFADAGYDPATNKVQGVVLVDTLTTYTGNTVQTGDSYGRLGAPAGVSVSADVAAVKTDTAAILVDTAVIGTAGAGLTDLGGMSTTMKNQVNAEVDTALNTAIPGTPTADSINERIAAIDDLTQASGGGDLAAILTDTGTTLDTKLNTAQSDLDTLTGSDGALIATGQTAAAWSALEASAGQILERTVDTVVNTHTPTTTEFQADDETEATTDHYKGRVVIFTSGALIGQATDITAYSQVGGIGQFTVTATTEAPANNDTFVII